MDYKNGGAIIPLSSIYSAPLTTDDTGRPEFGLLIGPCAAAQRILIGPVIPVVGSYIDNYAFSMPREGVVTALNVVLSVLYGIELMDNAAEISAQIWYGAFTSDTYIPLEGTRIDFKLSGYVEEHSIFAHTVVPRSRVLLTPGERLVLVVSMNVEGSNPKCVLPVKVSAGLAID